MPSTKRLFFLVILIFCGTNLIYLLNKISLQKIPDLSETESEFKEIHKLFDPTSTEVLLGWRKHIPWKSKLDQHEYRYLINPDKRCQTSGNIALLILIKTRLESVDKRNLIRRTYGKAVLKYKVSATIVFLVGRSGEYNPPQQAQLHREASIHGDILQEDFIDSYHNLTIKLIMGFKWASIFCTNSDYVMSVDDDCVVDVVNLVDDLPNMNSEFRSKFVLAEPCINWTVPRDPAVKWYTPREFYSDDSWPPFPRGYGYIVSRNIAHQLYRASQKIAPVAPWDDVYCGMLLQSLDVKIIDILSWYQARHSHEYRAFPLGNRHHYVVFQFGNHPLMKLWKAMEDRYRTDKTREIVLLCYVIGSCFLLVFLHIKSHCKNRQDYSKYSSK